MNVVLRKMDLDPQYNISDQGGTQYGNLTRTVQSSWNGTQWVDYRASKSVFVPNTSNHLTKLPARSISLDCASGCDFTNETGKVAESMQLYDNATSATTAPTYGKPTATRTWITGTQYSQVNAVYDTRGNQTSQTTFTGYGTATSAPTTGSSTTSTAYETTFYTYATSTTNALNQTTSTAYNYTLGVPISMTDPNNATTSAEYDVFGRMVKVIAPGDTTTSPTLGITYYDTRTPFQVDLKQKVNDSASIRISRFYSGLGNLIQSQTVGAVVNGSSTLQSVVEDTQFDNLNRAVKTTKPNEFVYNATPTFKSQDFSKPLTQTAYDLVGRPTTLTEPNANVTTYAYNGLITSITDPANNTTTSQKDAWGRVVLVDAPTGPDLTYTYNTRDLLTRVQSGTGGSAIQTNITYNQAGQKTAMDDPDMGDWTYAYNGTGNLISQTDARSCATNLSYDALSRLTGKNYSGAGGCSATPSITYTYDVGTNAIGHRTSMTDGSGSTAWTFDNRGRTLSETKTIDSQSFTTAWTYNSADQPVTMTYPDNEVLTYGYNSQGSLNTITSGLENYLTAVNYDAVGRITQMNLGSNNLLQKRFTYYDWNISVNGGKLSSATVANSGGNIMALGYTYDSRGNINQITDSAASETSAFTYDAISRLTAMTVTSGGNTIHSEAFTYNAANGNLTGKGPSTTSLTNYTYGGTQPHAVTETNSPTAPNVGTPTDSVVSYKYDGDGSLVKSVIDGKITYYPSSYYEKRVNGTQTTILKYYYAGSARIAVREGSALTWLVSDNLGSTSMTVNGSGAVLNTIKYTAFGEIRSGTTDKTDYQYTGQRNEEEIGLYFYNARWYDPSLGRFTQADTLVPDPASAKTYDRYTYVNNNPINFNDPMGKSACWDDNRNNPHCQGKYVNASGIHDKATPIIQTIIKSFTMQIVGITEKGESYSDFKGSGDPNNVIRPKWDVRKNETIQKPSPDAAPGAVYDVLESSSNASIVLFPHGDQIVTSYIDSYESWGLGYLPSPKLTDITITNNSELLLHYSLIVSGIDVDIKKEVTALPNQTVSFNFSPATIPNDGLRVFINASNACTQVCFNGPSMFRGWSDFIIP
jgi:RHS repeat-associated protein